MNPHAIRLTQRLGFDYCSDGRGTAPHMPVARGELTLCPQIPTTLPTLDELIGLNGITADNVHEEVLRASDAPAAQGHVYTLHAELEGMKLRSAFERLLQGWRERGHKLVAVREIAQTLQRDSLPRCEVAWREIPGRSGTLMFQGDAV
jgi:undecaprenyl phosphate-alpha-L-ara4FN deformylase